MPGRIARLTCLIVCCFSTLLSAQDAPRIRIAAASDARLREDLQALVELAPANLKKQWKLLDETLEGFEEGVDLKRPIVLDLVFNAEELGYAPVVPITDLKDFISNLKGYGYLTAGPDPAGLYTITEKPPVGKKKTAAPPRPPMYMRVAHNYAFISTSKSDLPANVPNPVAATADLLKGPVDVAALLTNTPDSVAAHRKTFQALRKQLEAAIQFKRGEAEADFEFRKLSSTQMFDEAERFLVETQKLLVQWTTDSAKSLGSGSLELTALPKSDLEASIRLLVNKPSRFANVKLHPQGVVQVRVNFALDPMRTAHGKEMYAKLLPVMKNWVDARPALNANEKAAGHAAFTMLFEMLNEGLELHNVDLILDLHAAPGGKQTGVCGIRVLDGTKAVTAFSQFPKIRDTWKFDKNVAEHAGVALHTLKVAAHRKSTFEAAFGGEAIIHIGTSKDFVFAAAGENSLAELKALIDAAMLPVPEKADQTFADGLIKFGPVVEILHAFRQSQPAADKNDKDAVAMEKQLAKMRKYANEAFGSGDDLLTARLVRDGDTVRGEMKASPGCLKFVGTMIADFVAENF